MLLFKYVSPGAGPRVLEHEHHLMIRSGLPSTYIDPYELFFQPERPIRDPGQRAFYDYFLGQVVQAPVTCFSRRPESVLMWAHYAQEGAGICLGFDEDALVQQSAHCWISDINYVDSPATLSSQMLNHAYVTGKRRHIIFLLAEAHTSAYFTKRTDWRYEAEGRLVVLPDAVQDHAGILLGSFNPSALRYIVAGAKVSDELHDSCKRRSAAWGVPLLDFRVGAKTFTPFFKSANGEASTWVGGEFQEAPNVCCNCYEPSESLENSGCQWCNISESARPEGSTRSMLAATLRYGIDSYPLVFAGVPVQGNKVKRRCRVEPVRASVSMGAR